MVHDWFVSQHLEQGSAQNVSLHKSRTQGKTEGSKFLNYMTFFLFFNPELLQLSGGPEDRKNRVILLDPFSGLSDNLAAPISSPSFDSQRTQNWIHRCPSPASVVTKGYRTHSVLLFTYNLGENRWIHTFSQVYWQVNEYNEFNWNSNSAIQFLNLIHCPLLYCASTIWLSVSYVSCIIHA